jgi:UDP-N-acetylmuramate dehydrogenase
LPNALHNEDDYEPSPPARRAFERIEEIEAIARSAGARCRTWQWLKNFTTLGVGGPVAAILYPETIGGAAQLVHRLDSVGLRWRALGHGTSILAADDLHDCIAISLRLIDERLAFDPPRVHAHAGYSLPALALASAERGLSGLELTAGLGGSLGGALRMNESGEIWSLVEEIVVADRGGLKVYFRPARSAAEGLRLRELILAATLRLRPGDPEEILAATWRAQQSRLAAQPAGASGASRLLRPSSDSLIAELGLRGQSHGGARVSETNADFIVNEGGATAEDVFALTDLIRDRVRRAHGLELEYDVDVWRDEPDQR